MKTKEIVFLGQKTIIGCDENCNKSWGFNNRPKVYFDENDEDDYAFLADGELGNAPVNPETYEGGQAKPQSDEEKLNKWCCRECERCFISKFGELDNPLKLRDFNKRVYNLPSKHKA